MKRTILTIVGSMLISLCAVQAQQREADTLGTASKSRTRDQQRTQSENERQRERSRMNRDEAWQQRSDRSMTQDSYAHEGMVIIDKNEIPSSLKETLKEEKYAGWENATIYHNTNTGEYVIAPRAYRFDKQGQEIDMPDANTYGNRQGRPSRYSPGQPGNAGDQREGQRTSQEQARDQMGEIPTSATEDAPANETDQASQQSYDNQSSQNQQQSTASESQQADRQQPSAGYRTERENEPGAGTQTQPGQSGREQYNTEGMVEVQAEQIPASLRRTLRESKYKGWEENGTLYQDPATSEYVLVMDKTDNGAQSMVHRFDKNGQVKEGDTKKE